MSRAKRVDANQSGIVKALRGIGAMVECIHSVGKGVPDIIVIHRGKIFLPEIKDGTKPPSARRLTEAEIAWHEKAKRHGYNVPIWESVEQAIEDVTK